MSGVYAITRRLFDHPLFADEPFTEREAWIWLIGQAAWRATRVRAGTALVALARGELAHSIRFMAEKWGWHPARVQRFLNRLKIETMVSTRADTGITVITICKYNEYQRVSLPRDTATDTQFDTAPIQQRYREEDRESIEDKEITISSAPAAEVPIEKKPKAKKAEGYSPAFLALWQTYRSIRSESPGSKKDAAARFEKLSPEDQADCQRGMEVYAGKMLAKSEQKYVCQLVVFVNGRRWEPELETIPDRTAATGPPQPPESWMPSDAELRRKYANGSERRTQENPAAEPEGGGVLPASGGVHRASQDLGANELGSGPEGQRRVPGLGGVFQGDWVGAGGVQDGALQGAPVGHDGDPVAAMVRH